jgi:hypothetical protein
VAPRVDEGHPQAARLVQQELMPEALVESIAPTVGGQRQDVGISLEPRPEALHVLTGGLGRGHLEIREMHVHDRRPGIDARQPLLDQIIDRARGGWVAVRATRQRNLDDAR